MTKTMRIKSWLASCPEPVFALIYFLILRPLILWNYHQRKMGRLPDEWYWADSVGANRGYFTVPRHPLKTVWIGFLAIILALTLLGLQGCASVEKTLGAIDYGCVDIDVNPHTSDSGLMGRGIVLPEGEELTPETVELLCNY